MESFYIISQTNHALHCRSYYFQTWADLQHHIFFFVFQALVGDVNAINKGKKVEMFDGNSIYALWSEERIKLQEFHEAKDGSYSAAIFLYCMLNE